MDTVEAPLPMSESTATLTPAQMEQDEHTNNNDSALTGDHSTDELSADFDDDSEVELDDDDHILLDDQTASSSQQQLGAWLGQLQALSDELDTVQKQRARPSRGDNMVTAESAEQVVMRPKQKPAVAPKPNMDQVRYSMANLQESPDVDLDALLAELCELESQLNAEQPTDQWLSNIANSTNNNSHSMHSQNAGNATTEQHSPPVLPQSQPRPHSPSDSADSAFNDCASTVSAPRQHSTTQSTDLGMGGSTATTTSSRASLTTPSPTQLLELARNAGMTGATQTASAPNDTLDKSKADKIKLALEKMREASVKKIYVKVFTKDNLSRSMLIDERWGVGEILYKMAEKHQTELRMYHSVVEHYPDLHMERIYEDHENLVENILHWTRDSPNKLYFIERFDKYDVFRNPQEYLLPASQIKNATLDSEQKAQLVDEFFAQDHVQLAPDIEGYLWLKADGKKAWKKHYCVLRASGVYYVPKGKSKSSKDLVCLQSLEMVQVYSSIGWRKKYKAPTDFGFALKHPQIQVKASKYIKYLCAEDEQTYRRWMVALRIVKHGRQLLDNFEKMKHTIEESQSFGSSGNDTVDSASLLTPTVPHHPPAEPQVVLRSSTSCSRSSAASGDSFQLRNRNSNCSSTTNSQAKRNSRCLPVDSPAPPSETPVPPILPTATFMQHAQPRNTAVTFDDAASCNTIKRRPPAPPSAVQVPSSIRSPPEDSSSDADSLPPPPPELQADAVSVSDSVGHRLSAEFPEPPSAPSNMPAWTAPPAATFHPPTAPHVASHPPSSPPVALTPLHIQSPQLQNKPAINMCNGGAISPRKAPPPPPPKRSDTTRLSNGPPVAPKPTDKPNVMPKPVIPSAGEEFQSELAKAMARRQMKMSQQMQQQ